MEALFLILIICLFLAIKPVRTSSSKNLHQPPALSKKLESSERSISYQYGTTNDLLALNGKEVAKQKQSMTKLKVETFVCDGKTYLAVEQNGVLIVREDS